MLHLSADAPGSERAELAAAVARAAPAAAAFGNVGVVGRPAAGTPMDSSGLAATLRAAAPACPSLSGRLAGPSSSAFFPSSPSSSPAHRLVSLRAAPSRPSQVGVDTIRFRAVQDLRPSVLVADLCVWLCV